jgi:hypothetical protein
VTFEAVPEGDNPARVLGGGMAPSADSRCHFCFSVPTGPPDGTSGTENDVWHRESGSVALALGALGALSST